MPRNLSLAIKGIGIRAMLFGHGSWIEKDSATGKEVDLHEGIENLGYLMEMDGFTFFHSGDFSTNEKKAFKRYTLSGKTIDAVFLDRVFLKPEGMDILNNDLRAGKIILMHIEPGKNAYYQSLLKEFPDFWIFSCKLESRTLTK